MSDKKSSQPGSPITIKKYANRRLYNTATSSYVTLDHLCQMVKDGVEFVVYDAKTGEDITRSVLTQIIVEEEAKGTNLLPINFLRQLISFYGDNMQWMVPRYLEQMMGSFAANQERMRQSMQETFGGIFPTSNMEELSKQNLQLFENAMRMFSPFGPEGGGENNGVHGGGKPGPSQGETREGGAGGGSAAGGTGSQTDSLSLLKQQVDQLQKQLDNLSKGKPED